MSFLCHYSVKKTFSNPRRTNSLKPNKKIAIAFGAISGAEITEIIKDYRKYPLVKLPTLNFYELYLDYIHNVVKIAGC